MFLLGCIKVLKAIQFFYKTFPNNKISLPDDISKTIKCGFYYYEVVLLQDDQIRTVISPICRKGSFVHNFVVVPKISANQKAKVHSEPLIINGKRTISINRYREEVGRE